MLRRGVGGVLWILCLAGSVVAYSQSGLLYVNEEPLVLENPLIVQGASLLVPLVEVGPVIGLDIVIEGERVLIRGAGFRRAFAPDQFQSITGVYYVALDWICGWVAGDIHQVGGDTYVRTARPQITQMDAGPDRVTIRLDAFSPCLRSLSQQRGADLVILHFPHASLGIPAQMIRVGEVAIQEVRVVEADVGVSMSIALEPGMTLSMEESETEDSYVLTFRPASEGFHESFMQLSDGLSIHEWMDSERSRWLQYVYVEDWRDRFRLAPIVPESGYQSRDELEDVMVANGAVCALSMGCPAETTAACLVMEGVPYQVPSTPAEVLALDLFGRWTTFSSQCVVSVKHAGEMIAVDGVNRALAYDEVVCYSPGYAGAIARGIPGSFIAVKIRDSRVVSVYQGPFVMGDPSAILIVASGEAKTRLAPVELGDPIEVNCQFIHAAGSYRHAVSCGPAVLVDGVAVSSAQLEHELAMWGGGTVLACDWQGGLYLLSFAVEESNAQAAWDLMQTLSSLPTRLKDAVVLSSCNRGALSYASLGGPFQMGFLDPVTVALGLIPLAP